MSDSLKSIQKASAAEKIDARLVAVLETTVDAIITTNDQGLVETFNHAAEDMFRCRAKDIVGRNISTLMPAQHAAHHDHYLQKYGEAGKQRVIGRTRELNAKRFDGSEFPVELALSGADIAGQRFFTGIIRDISERRHNEAELHNYRERLENLVAERTTTLQSTNERLEKAQVELQRTNAQLEQLVLVDKLTSIGNRRAFDKRFDLEWRRQQRKERSVALLLCDVDFFKQYNDHYGHPAGDECLRRLGGVLRRCFQRANEFAARYGGEEFAVVLADTDRDAAIERAEALRQKVKALDIEHKGREEERVVTISVGVASTIPTRAMDQDTLIEAADTALYRAKQLGRDRIEIAAI